MWLKQKFEDNKIYVAEIGNISVFIQKMSGIWNLSVDRSDEMLAKPEFKMSGKTPEEIAWTHHVADRHQSLHLMPALPDRPVVVKPGETYSIRPDMELEVYIRIPLWLQLYVSSVKEENLILDVAAIEMSSTWFGDPVSGELAYTLPENIMLDKSKIVFDPSFVICPVRIKNQSESILHFERLSIHANQLNVYQKKEMLYSNEVRVKFRGEEQQSDVQIVSGPPEPAQGATILNPARMKENRGLLQKSFYFIKSFTQY